MEQNLFSFIFSSLDIYTPLCVSQTQKFTKIKCFSINKGNLNNSATSLNFQNGLFSVYYKCFPGFDPMCVHPSHPGVSYLSWRLESRCSPGFHTPIPCSTSPVSGRTAGWDSLEWEDGPSADRPTRSSPLRLGSGSKSRRMPGTTGR